MIHPETGRNFSDKMLWERSPPQNTGVSVYITQKQTTAINITMRKDRGFHGGFHGGQ